MYGSENRSSCGPIPNSETGLHQTPLFLKLKGHEPMVSMSVIHWFMGKEGWTFEEGEGVIADSVNNAGCMYEVYQKADATFTNPTRVVPVGPDISYV